MVREKHSLTALAVILALLICDSPAGGVVLSSYISDQDHFEGGTAKRPEWELRYAYKVDRGFDAAQLDGPLLLALKDLVSSGQLLFAKRFLADYEIPPKFTDMVFRDYYFDSDDRILLSTGAGYRLRYRWSTGRRYALYHWFPFVPAFYPTRCEIQFKSRYRWEDNGPAGKGPMVWIDETRFEFRNDSPPFDEFQDAPAAPWPVAEFQKIAEQGVYQDYKILPFVEMVRHVNEGGQGRENLELAPHLILTTRRRRLHIDVENPWGKDPNPEQVIFVSVDLSEGVRVRDGAESLQRLLEVEVEIDRSTLDGVMKMVSLKPGQGHYGAIEAAAVQISRAARDELEQDLRTVGKVVAGVVLGQLNQQHLPAATKYARLNSWIRQSHGNLASESVRQSAPVMHARQHTGVREQ